MIHLNRPQFNPGCLHPVRSLQNLLLSLLWTSQLKLLQKGGKNHLDRHFSQSLTNTSFLPRRKRLITMLPKFLQLLIILEILQINSSALE